MVAFVVALILLAAVAFAADRITAAVVGNRVADAIAREADGQDVSVRVEGFPFLTQLAGGRLDELQLSAASLTWDTLTFTHVEGTGRDVAVHGGEFGSITAIGLVPTATLQRLVNEQLARSAEEWSLGEAVVTSSAAGVDLEVTPWGRLTLGVRLMPVAQGRSIALEVEEVRLGEATVRPADLPFGLGRLVTDALGRLSISLEELPVGLTVDEIRTDDAGARVRVSGTDVVLTAG